MEKSGLLFWLVGVLAAVLVSKLWLVWHLGNVTPFYDQWDAEAALLYKPYLEGNLTWNALFAAHNEHRVFTTRLFHLALFELNGREWNPVLQMVCNAFVNVAAVGVVLGFAQSVLPRSSAWALWLFGCLIFAVPFGWDSTLQGFNTHFYLVLLLSFVLLWLCVADGFGVAKSIICICVASFIVLTMASGALSLLAAVAVLTARRFWLGDKSAPLALSLLLFLLAAAAIFFTPTLDYHAPLKAQTPREFLLGLGRVAAWPLRTTGVNVYSALLPLLMQAPLLLAAAVYLPTRDKDNKVFLFLVATVAWFWLQAAAFAYARYKTGLGSRYLDMLSVGAVLNFAAILLLWAKVRTQPRWRLPVMVFASIWTTAVLVDVARSADFLRRDLETKAGESLAQERNVRGYICSGDRRWLFDVDPMEIPYPSAARLQQLLDDQTIRSFLPASLFRPVNAESASQPSGG